MYVEVASLIPEPIPVKYITPTKYGDTPSIVTTVEPYNVLVLSPRVINPVTISNTWFNYYIDLSHMSQQSSPKSVPPTITVPKTLIKYTVHNIDPPEYQSHTTQTVHIVVKPCLRSQTQPQPPIYTDNSDNQEKQHHIPWIFTISIYICHPVQPCPVQQ